MGDLHYLYHPRVQEARLKGTRPMPLAAGEVAMLGRRRTLKEWVVVIAEGAFVCACLFTLAAALWRLP